MRSYAPGRYPIETFRNVFVTRPGITAEEAATARKLYETPGSLVIGGAAGGSFIGLPPILFDTFIYNPSYMDWLDFMPVFMGTGIGVGVAAAAYRNYKTRMAAAPNSFVAFKVELTRRQLGEFLILEEDWQQNSPKHQEIWDWATKQGKRRTKVPDSLFVRAAVKS